LVSWLQESGSDELLGGSVILGLDLDNLDLLGYGMHVKDALGACSHNLLLLGQFKHVESSFELEGLLTIVEVVAENVSSLDVTFINTLDLHLDVLASHGKRKSLILGVVNFLDYDMASVWQYSDCLVLNNGA
jgi:hypothetical protein